MTPQALCKAEAMQMSSERIPMGKMDSKWEASIMIPIMAKEDGPHLSSNIISLLAVKVRTGFNSSSGRHAAHVPL